MAKFPNFFEEIHRHGARHGAPRERSSESTPPKPGKAEGLRTSKQQKQEVHEIFIRFDTGRMMNHVISGDFNGTLVTLEFTAIDLSSFNQQKCRFHRNLGDSTKKNGEVTRCSRDNMGLSENPRIDSIKPTRMEPNGSSVSHNGQ